MNKLEIAAALKVAEKALKKAGEHIKPFYGHIDAAGTQYKSNSAADVVTKLDVEAERILSDELAKHDKTIGFLGEESGVVREGKLTWIADPIDGTAHFIRGLPLCTSMVALVDGEKVLAAAIYHFVTDEMYTAIRGEGAFCNGKPIHVGARGLGEAYMSFETDISSEANLRLVQKFRTLATRVEMICSGWMLCMIANGKLDGKIHYHPFGGVWDYAPGSLIVQEAGGVVANTGKTTYDYKNLNFIATNELIHRQLTTGPDALFPITD